MPTYSLPQFNLLCNIWVCRVPSDGAADEFDVPCQKYVSSRAAIPISPSSEDGWWLKWVPPIQLRFPRTVDIFATSWTLWPGATFEVPASSGQYYRCFWGEIQHEGFTNEYALVYATQCDADGFAFPPAGSALPTGVGLDACAISPPPPPPPPPPGTTLEDDFSEPFATNLTSHTMIVGPGWTAATTGNDWTVAAGANYIGTTVSGIGSAWSDGGNVDGTAQLQWNYTTGFPAIAGLIFRLTDYNNYYVAVADTVAGTFTVYKAVGLTFTAIGTPVTGLTYAAATNFIILVTIAGSSIYAEINGTGVTGSITTSDGTYTTQTKWGIWTATSMTVFTATFTNFIVTP